MKGDAKLLRLLIIDDFSAIVDRISRLLNLSALVGAIGNLKSVNNLEQSISEFQPDVIIMDLHVGFGATILQGIEAITQIKRAQPEVKIVVFTNFTDPRYRELSMSRGADFFLDKAFESDRLLDTVTSIYKNINSK